MRRSFDGRCQVLLYTFRDQGRFDYGEKYARHLAKHYGIPVKGGGCPCGWCVKRAAQDRAGLHEVTGAKWEPVRAIVTDSYKAGITRRVIEGELRRLGYRLTPKQWNVVTT